MIDAVGGSGGWYCRNALALCSVDLLLLAVLVVLGLGGLVVCSLWCWWGATHLGVGGFVAC